MVKSDRIAVTWWVVLLGLTLLSFESAWGLAWLRDPAVAVVLVFGIALVKVRIVILHFMDVRRAPWILRAPLETWCVVLACVLIFLWNRTAD